MLGLRKETCEGHLGGGVHTGLGKIITKQLPGDFLGEETWSLCAHILPSPRRCPICYEILDPLGIVRLEEGGYISEYELTFSGDGLGCGLFNPPVFSSTPNQAHQGRTDFKS